MKIKLLRSVLVEDADVTPTRNGTVVDIDETKAREFVALGLAEEVKAALAAATSTKKAPEPSNKMAAAPKNKSASASQ